MVGTSRLVVRAARVWPGAGSRLLRDHEVVIEGERVSAIRPQGDIEPDAQHIDLGDRTILPGLIDAHFHFHGFDWTDPGTPFNTNVLYRMIRGVEDARLLLDAGFTGARCLGSPVGPTIGKAIDDGLIPGPRVVAAGEFISARGGPWDNGYLAQALFEARNMYADGEDQCRQRVRERIRSGSKLIKVGASQGPDPYEPAHAWGDDPELSRPSYSLGEMRVLVEEAHRAGVKVSAHAVGDESIRNAIDAGVDVIEHGHGASAETLRDMAAQDCILVPTLALPHLRRKLGPDFRMADHHHRVWVAHEESMMRGVKEALEAGVSIAAGTDFVGPPITPTGENAIELELLVSCGLSNEQALIAGTATGATAMGRFGEGIGTLDPGNYADLIASEDDPFSDISAIRRIAFVMKGGSIVRDVGEPQSYDPKAGWH